MCSTWFGGTAEYAGWLLECLTRQADYLDTVPNYPANTVLFICFFVDNKELHHWQRPYSPTHAGHRIAPLHTCHCRYTHTTGVQACEAAMHKAHAVFVRKKVSR